MRRLRRQGAHALLTVLTLELLAGCSTGRPGPTAAAPEPPPRYRVTLARSPLSGQQQVVHVLNRLGYGPRPGDVERVKGQGLNAWIERQLEPERIADQSLEAMLGAFPVLAMSAAEPGMSPPPNTRSNSAMPVSSRASGSFCVAAARPETKARLSFLDRHRRQLDFDGIALAVPIEITKHNNGHQKSADHKGLHVGHAVILLGPGGRIRALERLHSSGHEA